MPATPATSASPSPLRVARPTVEYAERPLGLDVRRPRLSWRLESEEPGRRGQAQSAYRIRVATSPDRLTAPGGPGEPDVWDSGKVTSGTSLLVPYDGPVLRPRTRYFWTVRVWDEAGDASAWSPPSWWETGLLDASSWSARWIGAPEALLAPPSLDGSRWIWSPDGTPAGQPGSRWFRAVVEVPHGLVRGRLTLTAGGGYTAYVNGEEADHVDAAAPVVDGRPPYVTDVTARLRRGRNVLAVAAADPAPAPGNDGHAPGLLGALELTTENGEIRFTTGAGWKTATATATVTAAADAAEQPSGDWHAPEYDDGSWDPVALLAPYGHEDRPVPPPAYAPVAQLRHAFPLATGKPVARARLYVTALGLYEAHLNGRPVGDDRLAPGWTDYHRRVQYRTHDVTGQLRDGENVLAVSLAAGWYAGSVGWAGPRQYGDHPALLAQLEVEYADGSTDRVASAPDWRATTGPVTSADLLAGEEYDARLETGGWTEPGYDDTRWSHAVAVDGVTAEPVAQIDAPTRVTQELAPRALTEPAPGVHVFDLGQNMVGTVRLTVAGPSGPSGPAGTRIRLRYAEALNPDGTLYTANLRSARATDTYTLKGAGTGTGTGTEAFEPRFTFHGFRYVEVTGHPGTPALEDLTGLVLHTDEPLTLDLATDSPLLDQLHSNITWGLRGNFLSVPTDTPARDERLGWTGDINVFAPTAAYLMESARFLTKWLRDLRDAQSEDGAFPDVAPHVRPLGRGVAGWGDAGVTVPWALYQAYGDERILEESWPSMVRWLDHLQERSSGLLRPAEGYGDWLNIDEETPKDVIGTACFAHSADLAARAARVLGRDPEPYERLFAEVRAAFRAAYVSAGGRVKGDTQTAYVLALTMDLLTEEDRGPAADRLVELIRARDWHLATGFLGTPRLLPALTATGHTGTAHRLLHQRTYPSWGHQIDRGATTMWERWDSVRPDGTFQDAGMNSFNHYAYGSVGAWMYTHLAALAPASPGYRRVLIRPRPGGGVGESKARFDSPYGPVTTHWTLTDDTFRLTVTLPVNTTAEIWIPARTGADVTHEEAEFLRTEDDCAVFEAGSGTHHFATVARGTDPVIVKGRRAGRS
ncbi:family 78 glycoside hydrolase catalytic domain [Streptomyces sp. NPDC048172]|uniref:family 78 glycoside hydrolase catalytic domain n=1 Tax=Streptomyces sp. NPDC048172 TaxID=3365505 RepID=UPI003723DAB4